MENHPASKTTSLLSTKEFSKRTSLSEWTVRYYAKRGSLKSARVGRRVLIPDSEINRIASEGLPPYSAVEAKQTGASGEAGK